METQKPVDEIIYDRWEDFFAKIKLEDYGKYRCTKDDEGKLLEDIGITNKDNLPLLEVLADSKKTVSGIYFDKAPEWLADENIKKEYKELTIDNDKYIDQHLKDNWFWDKTGLPKKVTFFHPVKFLSLMDKVIEPLDFNPYEGKKYSEILYGPFDPIYGNVDKDTATVLSNPGMTTLFDETKDKDFKPVIYKGIKYCGVNGFFNAQYQPYHKEYKEYWHEGVDFRGKTGATVVSLVNGTVLRCGVRADKSKGGFIIIQSTKDENLYFLALHVDENEIFVKDRDNVIPGQILGKTMYIADSKGNDVSHLHVSVIKLPEGCKPSNNDGSGVIYQTKNLFPTWEKDNWEKMINPFNYIDTDTWQGRY